MSVEAIESDTILHAHPKWQVLQKAPGISLFRYDHNGDELASKKCPMCNHNGDKNGSKFWTV